MVETLPPSSSFLFMLPITSASSGRIILWEYTSRRGSCVDDLSIKYLVETCGWRFAELSIKLKECDHNVKLELKIPNWNCLDCIWEEIPTEDEADPDDDPYIEDRYAR